MVTVTMATVATQHRVAQRQRQADDDGGPTSVHRTRGVCRLGLDRSDRAAAVGRWSLVVAPVARHHCYTRHAQQQLTARTTTTTYSGRASELVWIEAADWALHGRTDGSLAFIHSFTHTERAGGRAGRPRSALTNRRRLALAAPPTVALVGYI